MTSMRGMKRSATLGLLGVLVGLISGCTVSDRTERDVEQTVDAWQRKQGSVESGRPANITIQPRLEVAVSQPAPARPAALRPFITSARLQTLIDEALQNNPGVQAAIADMQAKLARIPQVMALPDPMIRAAIRPEPIQTAVGDVVFTLAVGQTIPWPAKLERAGESAAAEVRMAVAHLNNTRLGLIADVERAYFSLYLMDRYLELTTANRGLLEDLEGVVRAQYEVGRVPQQDVLRVQTTLAKLRDDEQRYGNQRQAAAAALNQLLDAPPGREQPVTESIDSAAVPLDVETLTRLAEDNNPSLARLMEQIRRDEERSRLADLAYLPDVTLGMEWNSLKGRAPFVPPPNAQTGIIPPYNRASANGDDNWAITLQLSVPVWLQRIEAARREARHNVLRSQHELQAARNMVNFRIYDAWSRIEAGQRTVDLLRGTLIPQSRQTYEVTLTAYQSGTTSFLNVIDAWRHWLDFELMLHRETVDLVKAFSDLQREVGLELVRAEADPGPATPEE